MSAARRLRLLVALALPLLLLLAVNVWAGATFLPSRVASAAPAGVRVTFLYRSDSTAANGFKTFLEAGYVVTLAQIAADGSASISPGTTDLFMIGADTASGDNWLGNSALSNAISNSTKPVMGLGEGGRAYYARIGSTLGTTPRAQSSGRDIVASDFLLTHGYYESPTPISLPADKRLSLYNANVPITALSLSDLLPNGARIAALAPNFLYLPLVMNNPAGSAKPATTESPSKLLELTLNLFPILQENKKFSLWGFAGAPSSMTSSGQQLFLNVLAASISSLNVPLRSRAFVPTPGIDPAFVAALAATSLPNLHAYVQLDHMPSPAEVATLQSSKGVTLVNYLNGNSYQAAVAKGLNANDPALLALVRWMSGIPGADKIDPKVQSGKFESWADNGDGTVNLLVTIFDDVSASEAQSVLSAHSVAVTPTTDSNWAVRISKTEIVPLSNEDRVQWIQEGPMPVLPINDQARVDLEVDFVQDIDTSGGLAYRGLDGTGIRIMIVDTGINSTTTSVRHPDLPASKFVREQRDGNSHGTHVGGIAAGTGANSVAACPYGGCTPFQMRGMAPGARIAAYWADDAAAFDEAINTLKIEVSSHSYVMTCGDYSTRARDLDKQVRGDAKNGSTPIPARTEDWAAANQGAYAQYCTTRTLPMSTTADSTSGPRGFFSILSPAKNVMSVGALQRGAPGNVYDFSSKGPTWDGRIKPDVSAIGCQNSTDLFSSGYVTKCGTSMATPMTSGIIALVLQQIHRTFGAAFNPLPSTVKAIMIDTATDLIHLPSDPMIGPDPDSGQGIVYYAGPDWSTGYGAVNARRATGLSASKGFIEDAVSPANTTDTYTFTVSEGRRGVKVTLVWDDEPGNPALAFTSPQLVNDLDLRLIGPNSVSYYPYVLPALMPSAVLTSGIPDPITQNMITAAVKMADHLNNVEQVEISTTTGMMTGVWTIRVDAFALPNNKTQKYSIAADLRRPELVNPVQGAAVNAGDPNAPDKIVIQLAARTDLRSGRVAMKDVKQTDFVVTIDGLQATIVSGVPVGDQFWLVVQPQPVSGAGYKDLQVLWKEFGTARERRAALFLEKIPVDRVLVIDRSGSMADFDKMTAAQNAARLYVDQTNISDTIGVVAFESGASIPYSLTLYTAGSSVLNDAKAVVNTLTPAGATAMGQGLIKGQDELERVNRSDPEWHIVLLTDGLENVDPLWATPQVRDRIVPSKTIVDTVALGPPEAGQQALLATIASSTGGRAYAVSESGGFIAATPEPQSTQAFGDFALELDNKLADVYKTIAEDASHQQRLWEVRALDTGRQCEIPYEVVMEKELPQAVFAVNWKSTPGISFVMQLTDPGGNLIVPVPGLVQHRTDPTHDTWIIEKPREGVWRVLIRSSKCGSQTEYIAWLSARTPLTMQLFFGGDPNDRCVRRPVQILALLADRKAIPAPQGFVSVTVRGPSLEESINELILYDDGRHGDGEAHDGVYGNTFFRTFRAGNYGVKAFGRGTSNFGEPFERRRLDSFFVRPCVAYIYHNNLAAADSFEDLLENNSFSVDIIHTSEVSGTDLSRYNLVVVGSDTGDLGNWYGGSAGPRDIAQFGVPVIGNGEGGASFFTQLGLNIDWGGAAISSGTNVEPVNSGHPAWNVPYSVTITSRQVQIYEKPSRVVETFDSGISLPVLRIGRDPADKSYLPIVQQTDAKLNPLQYLLWGWDNAPPFMTTQGRFVYVNLAWYMRR